MFHILLSVIAWCLISWNLYKLIILIKEDNTPGTKVGWSFHDRTLAIKIKFLFKMIYFNISSRFAKIWGEIKFQLQEWVKSNEGKRIFKLWKVIFESAPVCGWLLYMEFGFVCLSLTWELELKENDKTRVALTSTPQWGDLMTKPIEGLHGSINEEFCI